MAGKPISVSIKFNGESEITLTPSETRDKELLAHATRGNFVRYTKVVDDGSITFILAPVDEKPLA